MTSGSLTGRVIVVTGASSGIGAGVARAAAVRGATVVLSARRADRLRRLAAELPSAVVVPGDLTMPGVVDALFDTVEARCGRLDGVINVAGQLLIEPVTTVDVQDVSDLIAINTLAPLAVMQRAVPTMISQGSGSVVNICTGEADLTVPLAGHGAYLASKLALRAFSQTADVELRDDGVRVSVHEPRPTQTAMWDIATATSGLRHLVPLSTNETAENIISIVETHLPMMGSSPPA